MEFLSATLKHTYETVRRELIILNDYEDSRPIVPTFDIKEVHDAACELLATAKRLRNKAHKEDHME